MTNSDPARIDERAPVGELQIAGRIPRKRVGELLIRRSLVRAQVGEPRNTRVSRLIPADFFASWDRSVAVLLP